MADTEPVGAWLAGEGVLEYAFAGKSDRRTAGSYKGFRQITNRSMKRFTGVASSAA